MASPNPPPPVPSHGTVLLSTEPPAPTRTTLQRNESSTSKVQRKKSLVRPERERIYPHHRQYHYRQRAAEHASREGPFAASTTGNAPLYTAGTEEGTSTAIELPHTAPPPPQRHRSLRDRVVPVRRGKSILGREDPDSHKDRRSRSRSDNADPLTANAVPLTTTPRVDRTVSKLSIDKDFDIKPPSNKWPSCWYMYSMAVSFWMPNVILSAFGECLGRKMGKEGGKQKARQSGRVAGQPGKQSVQTNRKAEYRHTRRTHIQCCHRRLDKHIVYSSADAQASNYMLLKKSPLFPQA